MLQELNKAQSIFRSAEESNEARARKTESDPKIQGQQISSNECRRRDFSRRRGGRRGPTKLAVWASAGGRRSATKYQGKRPSRRQKGGPMKKLNTGLSSVGFLLNGKPHSNRSGPIGENQRIPKPQSERTTKYFGSGTESQELPMS